MAESVFDLTSLAQPVRKSAQRMRWFVRSFDEHAREVEVQTGRDLVLDDAALADAFSDWLLSFEAQKPAAEEDRQDYVGFASGLMLEQLIRHDPARCVSDRASAEADYPQAFWPEGWLYVSYCLRVRGLVLEQDFFGKQDPSGYVADLRTWWSFKENVTEDAALARPFLDLFAGEESNWDAFRLFPARKPPFYPVGPAALRSNKKASGLFKSEDSMLS